MRLTCLKFRHVGPFGAEGICLDDLSDGLNVVCETNEFGKSSILKALETILFKPFSSADKQVKALRNAGSDDAPEGEITFSCDGRNYRLKKRFLKKKSASLEDAATGEVLARDRAAEEKMAELLRADRFDSGPSGLLWVRQGQSMEGVSDDGQVASRLEGELGTLVGGEKARGYLTRVENELMAYITKTGAAKKGGPLQIAQTAVTKTQSELTEATRLRDLTKETGTELARVRSEILSLESESADDDLAAQISETRQAIASAQSFANSLALLKAKRDQTQDAAARAAARQSSEIEKLVAYNEANVELGKLQTSLKSLSDSAVETRQLRDNLRAEIVDIEMRMETLSAARSRQETFARMKQRLEITGRETARLSVILEELDGLQSTLSKHTNLIAELPPVRRVDIETLRRADDQIRRINAELSALSTHLFLELSPEGIGKVSIDGVALENGPFELTGGAVVKLDGIGQLRSDDGRLRELTSERKQVESDYADLLEQFDVADVSEAIRVVDQRQNWEADRKRLTSDISRLAPQGRAALETDLSEGVSEIESLADRLSVMGDDVEAPDEMNTADELRTRRAKLKVAEDALEALQNKSVQMETHQARLRERIMGLNIPDNPTDRAARADVLATEKLTLESDARAAKAKVEDAAAKSPSQPLNMLEARLTRLENVAARSREGLEMLKTQAAALSARRDAAFDGEDADAKVDVLKARLKKEQADLVRHTRDKDVRLLLRDTLIETQARLREAYTAPVAEELAPLLSMVIPGARAGLGESLGVDTVHRDGRSEAITQLSGGTQEQFAILTRLAYARLLSRNGASAPVILDDALVYADDARRDAMFDVLNHVSSGDTPIQIIYLSCHKGATLRLGGTVIRPKPWVQDC